MQPVLFSLTLETGMYHVSSYRFFGILAAAYLVTAALIVLRRSIGLARGQVFLAVLLSVAIFLIGTRLLYVLLYLPRIALMPDRIFELQLRNFTLYGGLLAVLLLWWFLARKWTLNLPTVSDLLVPHVGLSLAIIRIGCFLNGCCYGKITSLPWAVYFPASETNLLVRVFGLSSFSAGLLGLHPTMRHPTQIYELVVALAAASIALLIVKYRRPDLPKGLATASFGLALSAGRLIVFFFRDFPLASDFSNILRGPVVYGLSIVLFSAWLYRAIESNSSPRRI